VIRQCSPKDPTGKVSGRLGGKFAGGGGLANAIYAVQRRDLIGAEGGSEGVEVCAAVGKVRWRRRRCGVYGDEGRWDGLVEVNAAFDVGVVADDADVLGVYVGFLVFFVRHGHSSSVKRDA